MPADRELYTPEERALIRAHEWQHIARRDPRDRALMAALQCVAWFNPLVHLAVSLARLDQELACDVAVLRRRRGQRALYAGTLLKTQLAATPLPFGCYWPARGPHPLETRIGQLRSAPRAGGEHPWGTALVTAGVVATAGVAWISQPPIPALVTIQPATPLVILVDITPPGWSPGVGAGR